jgi:hypothetical protein
MNFLVLYTYFINVITNNIFQACDAVSVVLVLAL